MPPLIQLLVRLAVRDITAQEDEEPILVCGTRKVVHGHVVKDRAGVQEISAVQPVAAAAAVAQVADSNEIISGGGPFQQNGLERYLRGVVDRTATHEDIF